MFNFVPGDLPYVSVPITTQVVNLNRVWYNFIW